MTRLNILIALPADRTQLGELALANDSGEQLFGPLKCYGKADNKGAADHGNPARDPTRAYGDTPCGGFKCILGKVPATPANLKMYGPNGYIVLDPVSGQAKIGKQNGRFGLLIHGGDLNAAGKLRPTFGCVRVGNDDLAGLLKAIRKADDGSLDLRCSITQA